MFVHYYRELLSYFFRISRDRDVAADIVQEAYARVLAIQQSGQPIQEPRALLYRTARNVHIDQHRRREIRGEMQSLDDDTENDENPRLAELASPSAYEPEAALSSAQGVDLMLETIGALPLRCREAFILYKFDGLSQAEVARRMGISIKMVERHVKLAMDACRRCKNTLDGLPAEAPASSRQP